MGRNIWKLLFVFLAFGLGYLAYRVKQFRYLPTFSEKIIDAHCHIAGIGAGGSGIFISDELKNSYKFPIYLWAFGVSQSELEKHGDAIVIERVSEQIKNSRRIGKAIILALDGVINDAGEIDRTQTQIYIPNEFVAQETAKYDNLMFGASINPNRPDALERLKAAADSGAVLVKWIPSIMDIDPSMKSNQAFYEKLIELKIPLLVHVGQERAFGHARDELSDPRRLELPLKMGVTVIAAHIATTGENAGQENFLRIMPMFKKYDNLYTDISSLTQINKLGYLRDALKRNDVVKKMIYGSDWPLQFFPVVSPWYHFKDLAFEEMWTVSRQTNQWDRDVMLKEFIGVPREVFTRNVLNIN